MTGKPLSRARYTGYNEPPKGGISMAWQDILDAARRAALRGPITSAAVAAEAGVDPRVASAWLGKFCRWGYVVRSGTTPGEKRWTRTYELTAFGIRYKPTRAKARIRVAGKDPEGKDGAK